MTAPLTPRRREILHVVHEWITRVGACPTRAQIASLVGVTPCVVDVCVNGLVDAGFLRVRRGHARSLEVVRLPGAGLTGQEWAWCVANPGRVRAMMEIAGCGPARGPGGRS